MFDATRKTVFLRGFLAVGVVIALIVLANQMGRDADSEGEQEVDEGGVLVNFEGESPEDRIIEDGLQEDTNFAEDVGSLGERDVRPVVAGEDRIDERPEGVGPTAWMAPAEDVDEEAMRERLDRGEWEQEFELSLREDRRTSTQIADSVVQECYGRLIERRPDASGRVAVQWRMQTEVGQGRIEAPEILLNRGLDDPQFVGCIIDDLSGLPFEAIGDGGDLVVRWVVSLP